MPDQCGTVRRCGGGELDCGECPCVPTKSGCAVGECGEFADGCGGIINCGGAAYCHEEIGDRMVCDPVSKRCECGTPRTCQSNSCGILDGGCGINYDCGDCSAPETCSSNRCCLQNVNICRDQNAECASVTDGCGTVYFCGSCPSGETCNISTKRCEVDNNCGSTGAPCSAGTQCCSNFCLGGQCL